MNPTHAPPSEGPAATGQHDDEHTSRCSLLGRAGRAAAATLAGIASVVTTPTAAAAHQYGCCFPGPTAQPAVPAHVLIGGVMQLSSP